MGGYASSFYQTGKQAVADLVNAISQAGKQIDEEKKKKQEEDFYNSVANLYSQWKQKQNTISNSGPYQLQGEVNNVFAPGNYNMAQELEQIQVVLVEL